MSGAARSACAGQRDQPQESDAALENASENPRLDDRISLEVLTLRAARQAQMSWTAPPREPRTCRRTVQHRRRQLLQPSLLPRRLLAASHGRAAAACNPPDVAAGAALVAVWLGEQVLALSGHMQKLHVLQGLQAWLAYTGISEQVSTGLQHPPLRAGSAVQGGEHGIAAAAEHCLCIVVDSSQRDKGCVANKRQTSRRPAIAWDGLRSSRTPSIGSDDQRTCCLTTEACHLQSN